MRPHHDPRGRAACHAVDIKLMSFDFAARKTNKCHPAA